MYIQTTAPNATRFVIREKLINLYRLVKGIIIVQKLCIFFCWFDLYLLTEIVNEMPFFVESHY